MNPNYAALVKKAAAAHNVPVIQDQPDPTDAYSTADGLHIGRLSATAQLPAFIAMHELGHYLSGDSTMGEPKAEQVLADPSKHTAEEIETAHGIYERHHPNFEQMLSSRFGEGDGPWTEATEARATEFAEQQITPSPKTAKAAVEALSSYHDGDWKSLPEYTNELAHLRRVAKGETR